MPGVLAIPHSMPIGQAIDDLTLVVECSQTSELENLVLYPATLVDPAAVHLVHIYPASRKIAIGFKIESSRDPSIIKGLWTFRPIWVIHNKSDLFRRLLSVKEDDGVVYGQLGKADDMNYHRFVLLQMRQNLHSHFFLSMSCERKHHPPMSSLNIALPSPATFTLE